MLYKSVQMYNKVSCVQLWGMCPKLKWNVEVYWLEVINDYLLSGVSWKGRFLTMTSSTVPIGWSSLSVVTLMLLRFLQADWLTPAQTLGAPLFGSSCCTVGVSGTTAAATACPDLSAESQTKIFPLQYCVGRLLCRSPVVQRGSVVAHHKTLTCINRHNYADDLRHNIFTLNVHTPAFYHATLLFANALDGVPLKRHRSPGPGVVSHLCCYSYFGSSQILLAGFVGI